MFHVERIAGDQWKVIDEDCRTVFIGTMRQAEDWLDCQENARRQPVPTGVWLRNLVVAWRRILARPFAARNFRSGSQLTASDFPRRVRH